MSLSASQLAVLGVVDHHQQMTGEPVSASRVARVLSVSRQRVAFLFRELCALGWLRGPGSPALTTRSLPPHPPLTQPQLDTPPASSDPGQEMGTEARISPPEVEPRTVELAPLSLRAGLEPSTIDDDGRTVDLTFSTGAPVERFDWATGKRYLEILSLEAGHVRTKRLDEGAPLLDAHSAYSVTQQLGATVPGTVKISKGDARVRARFSRRAAVEEVWQDVRDGIISKVSVGYRVYKSEETDGQDNALPVRKAVDWEPFEVSMVPIPADAGATVRDGKPPDDTNPCEIVPAEIQAKETPMSKKAAADYIAEPPAGSPPAPVDPPAEPTEADLARAAETERCDGILSAVDAARLPKAVARTLIKDGVPLVEAQSRIFAELASRPGEGVPTPAGPRDVRVGDDPLVHARAGIENAILHRLYPPQADSEKGFKLTDEGRPYRGMTLLETARTFLNAAGIRTTGMSKMELAAVALGLDMRSAGGMHSTSDFPNLLADVTAKTLRQAYLEAPQTYTPIARRVTLPDFKMAKRLQLGEAPSLEVIREHGEFTRGSITEAKEQFQLLTYGKIFAISRTALVNDDTDAFSRVPMLFGRSARNLESDLVWAEITANAAMGDGTVLFHADHANLAGSGAAPDVATIGAGRAAMRKQTALDGSTLLNIYPLFLVVPAALETKADQFVSATVAPVEAAKVNPFAGRLAVIAEPRLDVDSATAWYLAAEPGQIDVLEYAFLEGEEGPMVESRVGFDVDGLEVKARHDFAAKVIDHRGLYKNPGA